MRFFTDDYFHIGAAHLGSGLPCQDYALSNVLGDGVAAYAIVSDGCSTGGRTDSGSRVVAHTAEVAIRDDWQRNKAVSASGIPEVKMQQKVLMQNARQNLGLVPRDLLATCSYAYVSAIGGYVHLRGDGVMAFVRKDGNMIVRRFEWANNMPLYPAYAGDNFQAFIQAHGCAETESFTEEVWQFERDGEFSHLGTAKHSVRKGIEGATVQLKVSRGLIDDYAFVVLFTDGVTQVDGMDWKDAVYDLMSFKSVAGAFGKRRMIRFIKDMQKLGKGPVDDIAYAIIRMEEDNGA